MSTSKLIPDIRPAFNLVAASLKLVELMPYSKRPKGHDWSNPKNFITDSWKVKLTDSGITGYGLPLVANGLVSIDPDNDVLAAKGLKALGFDLEELMSAGVRTASTRPKSGGRSTFADPKGLRWLKFSGGQSGTILELRAASTNLQDVVAGAVYRKNENEDKDGEPDWHYYKQDYANGKTHADAKDTHLPPKFEAFWRRCSENLDFYRKQQQLFCDAIGEPPHLAVSSGNVDGKLELAFKSPHRGEYNRTHSVPEILERHGYTQSVDGRYAPATATGAPAVRPIPNKDGLWQSDHASDPLHGTFDAWTAYVVLDHKGDLLAAEHAYAVSGFNNLTPLEGLPDDASVVKPESGFIVSAQEFIAQTKPPHYLVERMLQKGYVYSCTAKWGHGKTAVMLTLAAHIALGLPFAGLRTVKSKVLFMAGENPEDVRQRLMGICKEYEFDIAEVSENLSFTTRSFLIDKDGSRRAHGEVIAQVDHFDVAMIDTLPTHSALADDNSNAQMLALAKAVRDFGRLIGGPAVIAMMHPPHSVTEKTLRSRGGGAFAGEIDAEIMLWRTTSGAVKVYHGTKFRGAGFKTLHFELKRIELPEIVDNFGESSITVVAVQTVAPPPPADLSDAGKSVYLAYLAALERQSIGGVVDSSVSKSDMRRAFDDLADYANLDDKAKNSHRARYSRGVADVLEKERLVEINDRFEAPIDVEMESENE